MRTNITHRFAGRRERLTEVFANHQMTTSAREIQTSFGSSLTFDVHGLFAVLNQCVEAGEHRRFLFIGDFLIREHYDASKAAMVEFYLIVDLLIDEEELRIAFACGIIHSTVRSFAITTCSTRLLIVARDGLGQVPMDHETKQPVFTATSTDRFPYRTSPLSIPMPKLIVAQIILVTPFIQSSWICARFSLVKPAW